MMTPEERILLERNELYADSGYRPLREFQSHLWTSRRRWHFEIIGKAAGGKVASAGFAGIQNSTIPKVKIPYRISDI